MARETRVLFGSLQRQIFLAGVLVDELHARHGVHIHGLVVIQWPEIQITERVSLHLTESVHELCDEVACHSQDLVRSVPERHDSLVICHNRKILIG